MVSGAQSVTSGQLLCSTFCQGTGAPLVNARVLRKYAPSALRVYTNAVNTRITQQVDWLFGCPGQYLCN